MCFDPSILPLAFTGLVSNVLAQLCESDVALFSLRGQLAIEEESHFADICLVCLCGDLLHSIAYPAIDGQPFVFVEFNVLAYFFEVGSFGY
jgi:hypothetical protein